MGSVTRALESWDTSPVYFFQIFFLSLSSLSFRLFFFVNMCGISALILADSNGAACPDLFESLGLLQHRGQVSHRQFGKCRSVAKSQHRMLQVSLLVLLKVVFTSVKEMEWLETYSVRPN